MFSFLEVWPPGEVNEIVERTCKVSILSHRAPNLPFTSSSIAARTRGVNRSLNLIFHNLISDAPHFTQSTNRLLSGVERDCDEGSSY